MNDSNSSEQQLRAEIEQLRQRLADQERLIATSQRRSRPSGVALAIIGFLAIVLLVAGFFAGYLPRQRREAVLAAESKAEAQSLPSVNVVKVQRSEPKRTLLLPGSIQAVTEAPVLARAGGYLRKRFVDIGDRVREGQALAEVEAPELDRQVQQARAALEQASNASMQAEAALKQGRSNENLARTTAQRWQNLFNKKVVSRQEYDTYQAQWASQQANVEALEKAAAASKSNIGSAQASLDRLLQLKDYQTIRAPFAGVITMRNVDTGALINENNTLLFRIAQTDRLRMYINVPQSEADAIHNGQKATLIVPDLPGRKFEGVVTRTASALDQATRTMLTEIQVDSAKGTLLPGMYAQAQLTVEESNPSLTIKGDTLVVRSDGPQVAVVDDSGKVHFTRIQLGRDYGDRLEVVSGLQQGQRIVVNPSDAVREGAKVKPVTIGEKGE